MEQQKLWDDDFGESWEDHWTGMLEFVQNKQEPFAKIIVRFETEADLMEFSELIGQKVSNRTKSIWHPHRPHRLENKKVWRSGE